MTDMAKGNLRRNDSYVVDGRITRGAESVLYRGRDAGGLVCVKRIRNNLGKLISSPPEREDEGKRIVPYAVKVRHLKNAFAVGQKLKRESQMPVVRMHALKRRRRFLCETGYDLVMEYLAGVDLGNARRRAEIPFEAKVSYFHQAALALRYMHRCGFVHLDVKPSNIMVCGGRVTLIDFGVSMPIGQRPASAVGTRGFFSPEQLVRAAVNEATDVFALGVTFAVVFGAKSLRQRQEIVNEKATLVEARYQLTTYDEPLIHSAPEAEAVPELHNLIRQCTIPMREHRVRGCGEVAEAIHQIAQDNGIKL